ncbi:hypothetical protein J1N35_005705 [Gossypium stocksii]|uniref:Uncharacterized protein n=1 Tax=Gossypium stocksii TaxID=47602 RepID=A0A9D3WFT5_9ROSI|nr:hypothetical protein J1N35_005705 [Gossypium stocksii]
MLEFPLFSATLLSFAGTVKEHTQPANKAPTQTATEELKKTASLNTEKEEEGEKDDIATTKGKDPVLKRGNGNTRLTVQNGYMHRQYYCIHAFMHILLKDNQ